MNFGYPAIATDELVLEIVRLLPEYLPGLETGSAASTEGRTCWIRSWKGLLTALGRERGFQVPVHEEGDSALTRQLTMYWKRGDAIMLAAHTGFGSRDDMERRFQQLETIKASHKLILYSCLKWQQAVIEQLDAALLRYPHHIEGEQYLAVNLMASQQQVSVHWFTVKGNGPFAFTEFSGSPFSWQAVQGRGAAS